MAAGYAAGARIPAAGRTVAGIAGRGNPPLQSSYGPGLPDMAAGLGIGFFMILVMSVPRPEYPRPQLRREHWRNLNGPWRFAFDDDVGRARGWQSTGAAELDGTIVVPFCPQSALSGIGEPAFHDVVSYARTFATPPPTGDERVVLHFGAVDYRAEVWVNGQFVAGHEGGHTPFGADVTDALAARRP